MPSLEQSIKDQFAKVFVQRDWRLFKEVAEINFSDAATLRRKSFPHVVPRRKLLMRNVRKRLLTGIGAEPLLKAVYLNLGFGINRPAKSAGIKSPFKLEHVGMSQLNLYDTYSLAELIDHLPKIVNLAHPNVAFEGFHIARIFRNKEGHVVTRSHKFDQSSYRKIEAALVELYSEIFNERLSVRFSFAPREKGIWHVEGPKKRHI